ncbi:hypothetical protein ACFQ60_07420 [Streptomyces zhihengii]
MGLIDLDTATVLETYPRVAAVSSTRVAWTEPPPAPSRPRGGPRPRHRAGHLRPGGGRGRPRAARRLAPVRRFGQAPRER